MKEISLHILDIVQNSVHAQASIIEIKIVEDSTLDSYLLTIKDNGKGMNRDTLNKLRDPFFTTKNKKTGLGIPLLQQHAELAGGHLQIYSELDKGTTITAQFGHAHIDRQPLGDMASTFTSLLIAYPSITFIFSYQQGEKEIELNTDDITKELEGIPITTPEVLDYIKDTIRQIEN